MRKESTKKITQGDGKRNKIQGDYNPLMCIEAKAKDSTLTQLNNIEGKLFAVEKQTKYWLING